MASGNVIRSLKLFFIFLFLGSVAVSCNKNPELFDTPIAVGNKKIFVAVADTPKKMSVGLSGKKNLSDGQGMLFVFNSDIKPKFWMKDMRFNLDILWIKNQKILAIMENVPKPVESENPLPTYSPTETVDTVLEVNAGWSKKYKVNVGDEITFIGRK